MDHKNKSGFVTIIGRPNVGKSTLMNVLLGQKLSIATNKPQTTRKRILGILSEENYQIIFLDTPGILEPTYLLQEKMLDYVLMSVRDSDILLLMADISTDPNGNKIFGDEKIYKILKKENAKKILLINKVDLSNQNEVEALIKKAVETKLFDIIIPISAITNYNVDKLLETMLEYLPEHPKFYPEDQVSDETERFFVTEIIREKIFEIYRDEVPYSTEVLIAEFKEREGRKDYISAEIVVEKETQKPIIIGKKGESIKKLGQIARADIENFLQREVYLELRVKVRKDWRSNPSMLKNFGYDTGND